jgi:alpha-1,2-mannosyltransferase
MQKYKNVSICYDYLYQLTLLLQSLCEDFQVSDQIDFCLNISFSDLKSHLAEATVGLHTMYNEHFGIGVVEMMAGGAIVVAHASGGPKLDIVVPFEDQVTGFLAHDADDYALAMQRVLGMRLEERIEIRERARASVKERFSDQRFSESFLEVVDDLLPKS